MEVRRSIVSGLTVQRDWSLPSRWLAFAGVTTCLVIFVFAISLPSSRHWSLFGSSATVANVDIVDQRLQRAATLALGDKRGTVIVMDPQTGRVRAVVNPEIAFEENLPPGSTIKPFTALAALRSGVISADSRTLCREKYAHDDFQTVCSHPRDLPPFDPTDAIAYSCNYYFGKVGEGLAEANFDSTVEEFGFGKLSGINAAHESPGLLRRSQWRTQNAIGEGDYLRATPIQVVNAYSTLVNGGHLFRPRIATAAGFVPELRASVSIDPEERSLILKGMRGAVRYGTAETATLYSLPIHVFGKTGTATEINGYRSQGWFIGFASTVDAAGGESEFAPEKARIAVLVFLTRAHGSEAAEAARSIFQEYARVTETAGLGDAETRRQGEGKTRIQEEIVTLDGNSPRLPFSESPRHAHLVRVHLVRENLTQTMSIEDYVRGVVAAEGSTESETEGLKALAIASRTYILKNLGRHARDGYDFCTTTHCQRFHVASQIRQGIEEAVAATNGEVLRDGNNDVADAYFSASCGGETANMATLWGSNAPVYLRGVHDEYCPSEAHHAWTDVISQTQLLKALQTDPRTNVGDRLVSVNIQRTDASGRAELIAIEGNRRLTVKGWDFKIIVGRALGWNLLKSSRFEITRAGSNFIFRGSGFGHGLGLCQEGAHVMAARGAGYRQILAKYFPGTAVSRARETSSLTEAPPGRDPELPIESGVVVPAPRAFADLLWNNVQPFETRNADPNSRFVPAGTRRTLRSENFRISYPGTVTEREVEALLNVLQSSRRSLIARVAAAGVSVHLPPLEVFINETTGDFVGRTGQPAWAAAATSRSRIELQPLATLKRRRILETTMRHELVHALVEIVGRGRAPRWLAEGLALHLAGEGRMVARYQPRGRMTVAEIDRQLEQTPSAKSASDMRSAYAAAYGEVKRLIDNEGEASVWLRVAK